MVDALRHILVCIWELNHSDRRQDLTSCVKTISQSRQNAFCMLILKLELSKLIPKAGLARHTEHLHEAFVSNIRWTSQHI